MKAGLGANALDAPGRGDADYLNRIASRLSIRGGDEPAFDPKQRQRAVELTNLIYRQIRYGCDNPDCNKPACHNYRSSRRLDQPYRRPTKLAARHMAACIAASDTPLKQICAGSVNHDQSASDIAFPLVDGDRPSRPRASGPQLRVVNDEEGLAKLEATAEPADPSSSKADQVDEKSFSQMLFSTTAWQSAKVQKIHPLAQVTALLKECYDHRHTGFVDGDADIKAAAATVSMALTSLVQVFRLESLKPLPLPDALFSSWVALRQNGRFSANHGHGDPSGELSLINLHQSWTLALLDDHALSMMRLVILVFASRTAQRPEKERVRFEEEVVRLISARPRAAHGISDGRIIMEWSRYVLQLKWDNKAVVSWSSMTGATINFMSMLYSHHEQLGIDQAVFATHFLFKRTDFIDVAKTWLSNETPTGYTHMLSFPWLFEEASLVSYFRAMNHTTMGAAVNASLSLQAIINRHQILARPHDAQIYERLRGATSQFLVLEINRSTMLEDALAELWRRDKQQLRRPLKVRMGMEEGEEGVDLGGVQQEFLRLAFAEVMNPDYGAFTVDERTRMSWFMPCSQVPDYQYQLMGLLMGLAVYNGITLSVTFPEALYRKLLGQPVDSLAHIGDGWPDLARGLQALLDFDGGDVEDVFVRSYVFSTESTGAAVEVSMQAHAAGERWPRSRTQPGDSAAQLDAAPLVTNATRAAFVADYVGWLAHRSVADQYAAFAAGFFTVAEPRTLGIFSPGALRALVEGYQHEVDVDALERTATYESGYSAGDATMRMFWEAVRRFSPAELLKLLAFVTASDRVPARGIEAVTFAIQRNGDGDLRLPTSMTCFGRLLLPAYSSADVMEQKLRQAVENGLGFGVA